MDKILAAAKAIATARRGCNPLPALAGEIVPADEAEGYKVQRAVHDLLLDDRDVSAGVKLKDSDLIGFPVRILLSAKTLQQSSVEFKLRTEPTTTLLPCLEVVGRLKKHLSYQSDNVRF